MKIKLKFRLLFALGILTLITSCISVKPRYFEDDKKLAIQAVETYHQLYNEKRFEEIYNNAHEEAKATKDKQKLIAMLDSLYSELGKVERSQLFTTHVSVLNVKERQVEIVYKVKHEKGARNEAFLIVTNDTVGKIHTLSELTDEELKTVPQTDK